MKAHHSLSLLVLVLKCVLSLQAGGAAAISPWPTRPAADATPPAAAAVCRLHLEGFGNRPGFKKAQLSCTGGSVSAAADPQLLKALGPDNTRGVVWSRNPACQGFVKTYDCLLVLCKGTGILEAPTITHIKSVVEGGSNALCISGGTWWLVNGTFSHNKDLRQVRVSGRSTAVHIKTSAFVGNDLVESALNAPAVAASEQAKVQIQSSSFVNNLGGSTGAILADSAHVDIMSQSTTVGGAQQSVFQGNFGDGAGDILVVKGGHVRVFDAHLRDSSSRDYGGSIIAEKDGIITLVNTTITNATSKGPGGAISVTSGRLEMFGSTVQHCTACPECNGGAIDADKNATVLLVNSRFVNNSAQHGGALHATDDARITLDRVTFVNNRAECGGGLDIADNTTLELVGVTRVQHNHAGKYAGGVFLASSKVMLPITATSIQGEKGAILQVTNNTAPLGPNVLLAAVKVEVVGTNSSLDNFVTSIDSDKGLLHVVLNVSGVQGLPASDPITLKVYNARNVTVATDTLMGETIKGLRHVAAKLKQPPGSYRLEFDILGDVPPATLQLRIVGCPAGYVTASSGDACSFCVRGYFSFNPTDKECSMCVPHAECPGGDVLQPVEGFWHSAPRSTQMHRCINPAACLGSVALAAGTSGNMSTPDADGYKTAQCAPTYEGNLCAGCKQGYGKSRPFQCRKCMGRAAIVVLYLGAALAVVGLIKLLTFLRTSSQSVEHKSLQEPLPEELVKVLVLHGQWLFILSNLVGVPWPSTLMAPLQVISGLWSSSSGSSIGLDCILPRTAASVMAKSLLRLFMPAAALCLVLVLEAVLRCVRPARYPGARHQLATLVITVVFLFLPTWLSTAFSLFTCIRLDQPASWPYQARAVGLFWVEDVGEQCWVAGGYHRAWAIGLGVPLLLMLCVLLPAGLFVFLWHSRKRGLLSDPVFVQHYGFMYQMWREKVCWYESVVALQTIGLSLVSTFGFALDSYLQAVLALAVLGFVVVLLLWVRPFKCRAANSVAVQSACALLLTAYAALTLLPYNNREPSPVYGNIMGVVLLLLNLGFLVLTGWKLARAVDWSVAREWLRSKMAAVWGVKAPEQGSKKGPAPGAQGVVVSSA